MDPEDNTKYLPYVIEPSVGVERMLLSVVFSAYDEEISEKGDKRIVLRLHPALAPYKAAVLPLIKKNHGDKATEIFDELSKHFSCVYDESANIGKRYRREDAIGTPYCITVDDNTLTDNVVTIRNRDTMEQITLSVDEIVSYIEDKIKL